MLDKIEHVALAVSDLDAAIKLYSEVWGLSLIHREVVVDQGVEEAMLRVGESFIQLLAPLNDESTVAKFLEKRGEGLHHIAYQVHSIDVVLAELRNQGAKLIDETPRRGSRDSLVAFVHPKGNRGVLVELVQLPFSLEGRNPNASAES